MKADYIKSANKYIDIQEINTRGEVCFFGRSNVGKSSLINALFGKIAFTSKKPGKTVSLNFYQYTKYTITDSPGYGFAGNSSKMSTDWETLVSEYLTNRKNLKMCYLLIDSRRGIMEIDLDMMLFFENFDAKYTIIYTKIDKINDKEQELLKHDNNSKLRLLKLQKLHIPKSGFFYTSSEKHINISNLLSSINKNLSSNNE